MEDALAQKRKNILGVEVRVVLILVVMEDALAPGKWLVKSSRALS